MAQRSGDGRSRSKAAPPAGASAEAAEPEPFEACLTRLEGLVDRLEDGELPLEEALAAFEEGVALTRRCAEQLDRAERRIAVLVREGRDWVERPFEAGEEGD